MNCRFGVGDYVDYRSICWQVVETEIYGGVWECKLRRDNGNELTVPCSELTPCTHQAEAVPVARTLRSARRPSKHRKKVTPGKAKHAQQSKKPVRRTGRS